MAPGVFCVPVAMDDPTGRRETPAPTRRRLLSIVGSVPLLTLSGCLDQFISSSLPATTLGRVVIRNYHDDPQEFEVQILRDGTVVHESSHELDGNPQRTISWKPLECTWGDELASYTLRGRVIDSEWTELDVSLAIENSDIMDETTECVIASGNFDRQGEDSLTWIIRDECDELSDREGGCDHAM